jgi:hypothetical protein
MCYMNIYMSDIGICVYIYICVCVCVCVCVYVYLMSVIELIGLLWLFGVFCRSLYI